MNLLDSSYLCLDIGTSGVFGMAVRISNGRIAAQQIASFESPDIPKAIKKTIDNLEDSIGKRFDSAFVTGNFGAVDYKLLTVRKDWDREHKITAADISALITTAPELRGDAAALHIIPLRYDLEDLPNISTPVGQASKNLSARLGAISVGIDGISRMRENLRAAHIRASEYFDPAFLLAQTIRPQKESSLFLDLGASQTTVSLWTVRGPMLLKQIPMGQSMLTDAIAHGLDLKCKTELRPRLAEKIKRENISLSGGERDRFTLASASDKHDFTRADVNDLILPVLNDILQQAAEESAALREKYGPSKIYLTGGGANIPGIGEAVQNAFGLVPEILGPGAAAAACAAHIWARIKPRADAIALRKKKRESSVAAISVSVKKLFARRKKQKAVPVMPSTLAFNMRDMATYARFRSGFISMIHVDIMDGLYTANIAGGIEELKFIRKNTTAHLNVHLMTESPTTWAAAAAAAGADTIIVSPGTYGVRSAITKIKSLGKRAGIAISPDSSLEILKPVLREIDEVLVMSVAPGAGGQEFLPGAIQRIAALAATRKKYKLNFKISVDGGINAKTAQECWAAGADFLVSGNYLAKAADFPAAVISLLPQN
jgi:ribulose-phosphate 3-epimerase